MLNASEDFILIKTSSLIGIVWGDGYIMHFLKLKMIARNILWPVKVIITIPMEVFNSHDIWTLER